MARYLWNDNDYFLCISVSSGKYVYFPDDIAYWQPGTSDRC